MDHYGKVSELTYFRIAVYAATIALHGAHMVHMVNKQEFKIHQDDPNVREFGELRYRFFTCWNFVSVLVFLQTVYAIAGLTCDVLVLKNARKRRYNLPRRLRSFRDTLFSGILWPSTLLVFTIFWSLFLYDRELILPAFADKVLSPMSNHIIHTLILPIVLLEVLLRPMDVPRSHKRNLRYLVIHMLLYFCVLLYTYFERGIWIYPIFKLIYGTVFFPISILFVAFLCLAFYYGQWELVKLISISKRRKHK